jgi:hypothetical protein
MPGSERRIWEGKRLLRLDKKAFPVELLAFAFMCLVCTRDLRGVMGVDVLGEGLEELGELPCGLVAELGEFEYQTVTRSHVVGRLGGIGHCLSFRGEVYRAAAARRAVLRSGAEKTCR